jgi:cell division transport system permease protein
MASIFNLALPPHDRRLIPDGRFAGVMPWVMVIMVFLTVLACAGALLFVNAAGRGGTELAREATVQIMATDPAQRTHQQGSVTKMLQAYPGLVEVNALPQGEALELLGPALGDAIQEADLPVPAIIDLRFATPPSKTEIEKLRRKIKTISPGALVSGNASWLEPFFDLMQTLLLLSGAIVLFLLLATAATVALAVRGALNTHRSTIEIMHMMGATDMQAARLFQRRVALDALFGGLIGVALAIMVMFMLGARMDALAPALVGDSGFPVYGWPILAAIPLAVTGLAMLMARWTVLSALKKML